MLEVHTSEQLAYYTDTLKMLFEHAHREHNAAVMTFLRRYLDGLVAQAEMTPLVLDVSSRRYPASEAERALEATASALAAPVRPLPPDSGGGVYAKLPEPPPKPVTPTPAAAVKPEW